MVQRTEIDAAYKTVMELTAIVPLRTNTIKLNLLYNILCRARREAEYGDPLRNYTAPDGTTIDLVDRIETYFAGYNNFHGLDIIPSLTEFTDLRFAQGLYFIGKTYDADGNERAAYDYRPGEKMVFRVTLYSHRTNEPVECPILKWSWEADDANLTPMSGEVTNHSTVTFSAFINHPGFIRARVEACDENGKMINGAEPFVGGAAAEPFEVRSAKHRPHDFGVFWRQQMDRLYAINPIDPVADDYTGRVQTLFDLPKLNCYDCKKLTCEDLENLRKKQITMWKDSLLDDYDVYAMRLKAPGPAPSTFVISVPKNAEPGSLYAECVYDGYGAHSPEIFAAPDRIGLHITHHGYPTDRSDTECFNFLNKQGILGFYGRANGRPNSDYTDKTDCYILYMFLRDFQPLRFVADPTLNGDIERLSTVWNGTFRIHGGSMGGYQTIGICALPRYIPKSAPEIRITSGTPNIPAFCDLGGIVNGRVFRMERMGYEPNMDYFDGAFFAPDITADITIPRCALGDEACPTTTVFSMFNALSCPKSMTLYQNSSHGYIPEESVQIKYHFEF